MDRSFSELGRLLSYILRHNPSSAGIVLDEHGWASVDELVAAVSRKKPFSADTLREIVRLDDKQRYSFSEDGTKIRANQGHSIKVDVELEEKLPPRVLYHGTACKYTEAIEREGLRPKTRLYVHLSGDVQTARAVGARHGEVVVYRINAAKMVADGHKFYRSVNNVWLVGEVPAVYLERIESEA